MFVKRWRLVTPKDRSVASLNAVNCGSSCHLPPVILGFPSGGRGTGTEPPTSTPHLASARRASFLFVRRISMSAVCPLFTARTAPDTLTRVRVVRSSRVIGPWSVEPLRSVTLTSFGRTPRISNERASRWPICSFLNVNLATYSFVIAADAGGGAMGTTASAMTHSHTRRIVETRMFALPSCGGVSGRGSTRAADARGFARLRPPARVARMLSGRTWMVN